MKLSVICPVRNEIRFIKAWLANVRRYADEVIVCDTGSTDGTWEFLEAQIGVVLSRYEVEDAYRWKEGWLRNTMINYASGDYIVLQDADELFPENFRESFEKSPRRLFYRMPHLDFWYTMNTIRVRQMKKDYWRRFHPSTQTRVISNRSWIRYRETGNHAPVEIQGFNKESARIYCHYLDVPFFHYHHVPFGKENENRSEEIRESGIKLETYWGKHPKEIELYDFNFKALA